MPTDGITPQHIATLFASGNRSYWSLQMWVQEHFKVSTRVANGMISEARDRKLIEEVMQNGELWYRQPPVK